MKENENTHLEESIGLVSFSGSKYNLYLKDKEVILVRKEDEREFLHIINEERFYYSKSKNDDGTFLVRLHVLSSSTFTLILHMSKEQMIKVVEYYRRLKNIKAEREKTKINQRINELIEREKKHTRFHFSEIGWVIDRKTDREYGLLFKDYTAVIFRSGNRLLSDPDIKTLKLSEKKGFYKISQHSFKNGKYILELYGVNGSIYQFVFQKDNTEIEIKKHFRVLHEEKVQYAARKKQLQEKRLQKQKDLEEQERINQEREEEVFKENLKVFYDSAHLKIREIQQQGDLISPFENFLTYYDGGIFLDSNKVEYIKEHILKAVNNSLQMNEVSLSEFDYLFGSNFPIKQFMQLMEKKMIINQSIQGLYITWSLFQMLVAKQCHSTFKKEHALSWEEKNMDEQIYSFMMMPIINEKNKEQQAVFVYYLMIEFDIDLFKYSQYFKIITEKINQFKDEKDLEQFERKIYNVSNENEKINKELKMHDIDLMTGSEFEHFISKLFQIWGYKTNITKKTGDQGIDVIAIKNGVKIGIQTKCYANAVSNKAVQEVAAGIKHHQLDKGMLITNNRLTQSAISLAESNEIVVWDRALLQEKLNEQY